MRRSVLALAGLLWAAGAQAAEPVLLDVAQDPSAELAAHLSDLLVSAVPEEAVSVLYRDCQELVTCAGQLPDWFSHPAWLRSIERSALSLVPLEATVGQTTLNRIHQTLPGPASARIDALLDELCGLYSEMLDVGRDRYVASPGFLELLDRMGKAREDSTFGRKRFRGMRLTIGYPTPTILSGGTYGMVLLTDLDHMPLMLGGADNPEGSPFRMSVQRIKSYLSRGMVLAEGSPAWPVIDQSWRNSPEAPHEMPPVAGGIMMLYNQGTRGRWYWECPDCSEEFEPRFDRLAYDAALDPGAAGEMAEMGCPHCGVLIAHRHKVALNRAALKGRGGWRHEGSDGRLLSIEDPEIRKTSIASYALNGAAATFSRWADMVANFETARRRAIELGDDSELAAVHYTEIGVSHRRLKTGDDDEIGVQFLRDHMQDAARGMAPDWARFITVSVDVQATYFPVQVTAWGADGSSQVVDRFDLTQPPTDAPNAAPDETGNRRRLDPSRYVEDWQVLKALAHRVIPVQGQDYGLTPIGVIVDFQGKAGVSDNAEAFLMARRRAGEGQLWRLSRGQGGWRLPFRVRYESPERGSKGKAARTIKLLTMATDRLKDTIDAALRKSNGGAGAMYLPSWMNDVEQIGEYVAEERLADGWEKKKGVVRNEGLDLSVQARALAEHKGLLRLDPAAPPPWALGGLENVNAVPLDPAKAAKAAPTETPKRIKFLNR